MIIIPLLLVLLFGLLQICYAQEESKPRLFEELTDAYCSEILAVTLDYFSIEIDKQPDSTAYIIFNGKNSLEGKNLLYLEHPQRYLSRRIKTNSIVTVRGENRDKMIMQLWIVPKGAKPPIVKGNFVKEKIHSTILFDKSWADWHKWNDSKWTIYGYSFAELGCEMDLNMEAFADSLNSQSNLTGYLVVYTKFGKGKKHAKKVTDFAIKELTLQHKVPKEKLKIIYGGNRNEPQLELWLVPNGNNLPIPNPDKFIKEEF
jgi:hypothetical protein